MWRSPVRRLESALSRSGCGVAASSAAAFSPEREMDAERRVAGLDGQIHQAVATWSLRPVVEALISLRGVNVLTAVTVLAELGDLTRFDTPRQLMSHLGLVPSEQSSGPRRRQGGITKTGKLVCHEVCVAHAGAKSQGAHPGRIGNIFANGLNDPARARMITGKELVELARYIASLLELHAREVRTVVDPEIVEGAQESLIEGVPEP